MSTPDGVQVWSLDPEKLLTTFKEAVPAAQVEPPIELPAVRRVARWAMSADGEKVAIAEREALKVYSVSTGEGKIVSPDKFRVEIKYGNKSIGCSYHDNTRDLSFSPDGKYLAAWGIYGVRILDLSDDCKVHWSSTYSTPLCVEFSPDGKVFAIGDSEGKLALYDTATGKELRSVSLAGNEYL